MYPIGNKIKLYLNCTLYCFTRELNKISIKVTLQHPGTITFDKFESYILCIFTVFPSLNTRITYQA